MLKRFDLEKKSRKDDQFKISIAFQDTRLREPLLKVCLRVSVEFLNYNTKGSPINYDDVMSGLSCGLFVKNKVKQKSEQTRCIAVRSRVLRPRSQKNLKIIVLKINLVVA